MSENDDLDPLCSDCPEALSDFLQEIAEHNAKVTACPKCGKHHALKPQTVTDPVLPAPTVSPVASKPKRSSASRVPAAAKPH